MSADSLRHRARARLRSLVWRPLGVDALENRLGALEDRLRSHEQQFGELQRHLHDWHGQLAELVRATMTKASLDELRSESDRLRERIASIADALAAPAPPGAAPPALPGAVPPALSAAAVPAAGPASPHVAALAQAFYPALERQFRGTPEEIRERLRVYRERLDGLPAGRLADLGCGGGEWLALLREWGFDAIGVDSNALSVAALRAAGLDVVRDDAHTWLVSQPDASLAAITAFHLVEHLPFNVLLALLDAARRALAPGGLLLLETPNPENLLVATQAFWLDPTHRKPIPAPLLEFVVAWSGFECEAVLRLHPPEAGAHEIADETLRELVHCGRDYALVARRPRMAEAR